MKKVDFYDIFRCFIGVDEHNIPKATTRFVRVPKHLNFEGFQPDLTDLAQTAAAHVTFYGFENNDTEMILGIEFPYLDNPDYIKFLKFIKKYQKGFSKSHYLFLQLWDSATGNYYMKMRLSSVHIVDNIPIFAASWKTEQQECFIRN